MQRRTFLKWATNALGAVFGVVLGLPALAYLTDTRHRKAAQADFRTVARLSELRIDEPTQVVIRDVRRDAWTLHPDEVIGRVWLVRRDTDKVDAYSTICPHLGCSVNYVKDARLFICPCHNGTFLSNGQVKTDTLTTNPAPRGMDALEVRLVEDPDPGHAVSDSAQAARKTPDRLVEVKYQNFYQGMHEKVAKS
jgi:menaquinol-cytochrome c reductase iron-sulfur subunit